MRFTAEMTVHELLPALLELGIELQNIDNVALRVGEKLQTYVWLESNLNVYVAPTGLDDTTDPEQGMSAAKPFKTPQFALNHVCSRYNFNQYQVTVNLAEGDYTTNDGGGILLIPAYVATNGVLRITGPQTAILPRVENARLCRVTITGTTIKSTAVNSNNNTYPLIVSGFGSMLHLYGTKVIVPKIPGANVQVFNSWAGGDLRILGTTPVEIAFIDTPNVYALFRLTTSGMFRLEQDVTLVGSANITTVCATSSLAQFITANGGTNTKLGRAGRINADPEAVYTGKKYAAGTNSIIAIGGNNQDFFPGTVAGTVDTGGQYS